MKETAKVYALFFFINSIVYMVVNSLEKWMDREYILSEKLYVGFAVVMVLSVVSLLTSKIGIIVVEHSKNISRICLLAIIMLIVMTFGILDMYLLRLMTNWMSELDTSLSDRFLLTVLCQIAPAKLIINPKKF